MGQQAKGWTIGWRIPGQGTSRRHRAGAIAYVRFSFKGKPYLVSTGERDPGKAAAACARVYADIVQRGAPAPSRVAPGAAPLVDLYAEYIAYLEGLVDPETRETYEGYWKHFAVFADLAETTQVDKVRTYAVARLRAVLRRTVRKELSALRGFLIWCRDTGLLGELPAWVTMKAKELLPARAPGVRSGTQRAKANELSPEQIDAFLDALAEWSERGERKGRGARFPVRARFVVAYETGLRPATLDALVWEDFTEAGLVIRSDADKARSERVVPLSARARDALDALAVPPSFRRVGEPIFGVHDYRTAIRKACVAGGIDLKVAPYDFRHSRTTHLLEQGAPIPGVMHLVGHTQLGTTSRYTKPGERAARAALATDSRSDHGLTAEESGAKDGSRTRTGVTPLEPESSSTVETIQEIYEASFQEVAGKRRGRQRSRSQIEPWVAEATGVLLGLAAARGLEVGP